MPLLLKCIINILNKQRKVTAQHKKTSYLMKLHCCKMHCIILVLYHGLGFHLYWLPLLCLGHPGRLFPFGWHFSAFFGNLVFHSQYIFFCSFTDLTREWSGLSGWNVAWSFECLQSLSSNDCTQNFSCRCAVQGCEKIARSWDVLFKFFRTLARA
jgi:hypothetical protein